MLKVDHQVVKALFEEYQQLGVKAYKTKKDIAERICLVLRIHAMIEEEIFYPEVETGLKDAQEVVEALVEHTCAKTLIAEIESISPEDDLFDAKVKVLSEQIEHHVERGRRDNVSNSKENETGLRRTWSVAG